MDKDYVAESILLCELISLGGLLLKILHLTHLVVGVVIGKFTVTKIKKVEILWGLVHCVLRLTALVVLDIFYKYDMCLIGRNGCSTDVVNLRDLHLFGFINFFFKLNIILYTGDMDNL